MWSLLSLLFTSTLVAAAPRHHGLQHRQWHGRPAPTIVPLSSNTLVPSSTSSLLLWPSATPDTDTPSTSSLYAQPSATLDAGSSPSPPNGDPRLGGFERMSADYAESICHTCHKNNPIQWPLPDSANGVPMPMPIVDNLTWTQPSLFPIPEGTPYKLTIMNYCPYDLYFKHIKDDVILGSGSIAGNGGKCAEDAVGTVMKVGKDLIGTEIKQPVQIEYGATGFYDLSLIDCLALSEVEGPQKGFRTADTSACAGHEHGLQLSNPGSKAFQCAAGAWCDDQAYFYEENLCKHEHPNTSGDISKGLTMEFCASLKR